MRYFENKLLSVRVWESCEILIVSQSSNDYARYMYVGSVDFHRSRIGLLRQLHLEFIRLKTLSMFDSLIVSLEFQFLGFEILMLKLQTNPREKIHLKKVMTKNKIFVLFLSCFGCIICFTTIIFISIKYRSFDTHHDLFQDKLLFHFTSCFCTFCA